MKTWATPSYASLPVDPTQPIVTVYDNASKSLVPVGAEGTANLYVCGITPYDATHLGHAATYLTFDVLNRVWRDAGRSVTFVQNVTDIDDPLLERASATGQDWTEIALRETELFRADMAALNVIPPDHYESAVETIPDVVQRIQQLSAETTRYLVQDDVYFHSHDIGQVAGMSRADMLKIFGERGGDPDRAGKRNPLDCLLWQAARTGEPSWESVLGSGRPGWHIECVAIAMKYFTLPFDVQGGGSDLIFPHHDMCNAQALALTGKPLAKSFVHCGMIGYEGEKMSKSRGNLVLVSTLRSNAIPMPALRLALLADHYQQDREWHEGLLVAAQSRLNNWRAHRNVDTSEVLADVRQALRNNLDTESAIALLDSVCRNGSSEGGVTLADVADTLLGVSLHD